MSRRMAALLALVFVTGGARSVAFAQDAPAHPTSPHVRHPFRGASRGGIGNGIGTPGGAVAGLPGVIGAGDSLMRRLAARR